MDSLLADIPQFSQWRKIEKVDCGWSDDVKYYVEDYDGNRFLLRINLIEKHENKKKEFDIVKKFNGLDFIMSTALDFGTCNHNNNVYMLLSWVDGISLEDALPNLDSNEQYRLGVMAGQILKSIHCLPVDERDLPQITKIAKKLNQLERYENSTHRVPNDEKALLYVKDNIHIICQSKPTYEHGDFHVGNLIYTPDKKVGVIDFNRWECGDKYEEFYKMQSFDVDVSIPFSIGQIHGYFDGEPPLDFWKIQAIYVAHASLFSIEWATKFGQADIDSMTSICLKAFRDYDNFERIVPKWYEENHDKFAK